MPNDQPTTTPTPLETDQVDGRTSSEQRCVCPKCGHDVARQRGVPCAERDCPKCGAKMTGKRE